MLQLFNEFISTYGVTILYTILTALAGYIGIALKKVYTKYVNDKTKQDVAKTVVRAVEQIYTDLHGEEKYLKALESASEMLAERNIFISDLEMRMLIEAAVAELKLSFKNA